MLRFPVRFGPRIFLLPQTRMRTELILLRRFSWSSCPNAESMHEKRRDAVSARAGAVATSPVQPELLTRRDVDQRLEATAPLHLDIVVRGVLRDGVATRTFRRQSTSTTVIMPDSACSRM